VFFFALTLIVLVPLVGAVAVVSPNVQALEGFDPVLEEIKGLSFDAVSFTFDHKGVVVHAPASTSDEGLKNCAI
jgi:hypothetical protein